MPNTNCLVGFQCPICGNDDRFYIKSTIIAEVTDDGAEISKKSGDIEWDERSGVACAGCNLTGTVADFTGEPFAESKPVKPYTYRRDSDGTDETFDIVDGEGNHVASVPFWEDAGRAEATARLIVGALNRVA